MAYPVLNINQVNNEFVVQIINEYSNGDLKIQLENEIDNVYTFMYLLQALMTQYDDGYEQGWTDSEAMYEDENE